MGKSIGSALKRSFDILVSLIALTVLSPLIALIALAVLLDDGRPVLYSQRRVGKRGAAFRCYKFRTMVVGAEHKGLKLEVSRDDPRITRVGHILRQWTLDEIPQIINVLRGEMSMVGPRPGLPHQVERYTARQRRRLEVKPGMAGWALIHGRNTIPWGERIEHDVWYVDHWSPQLDLYIFVNAFVQLLRRQGLYGPDGISHDME